MSYRLNWTSEAEVTFNQNLEYLSNEWNPVVLNQFLDRVEEVFEKIKSNPRLYPLHRPEENIYKCVIHERIVLYYKVVDDDVIDLLTFWNTYQDPGRLKV
jgi:plasmid stabilization system protein ParE